MERLVGTDVRDLGARDLHAAGTLLCDAFTDAATAHAVFPPWSDANAAIELAAAYLAGDPKGAVVAESGGALVGAGFIRRRGDVATIGPLAARPTGRGVGSAILTELIARADAWGCSAVRLFADSWNPDAFALYTGHSFAAVDTIACLERPAARPPRNDSARGLEVSAFKPADLAEAMGLDLRLTGLTREQDLLSGLRLVARRRGALVGFGGAVGSQLGPVLALDVADLGALVGRLLADVPGTAVARLSMAAPTAMLAALALGFQVTSLGTLMVRGPGPPARPPQIYGLRPEIL